MRATALKNRFNSTPGWRANLRFLGKYLGSQQKRAMALSGLILLSIALQLINPQVIRYFLDTAGSGGPRRSLLLAAAAFIAFALFRQGIDLVSIYINQLVSWSATNRLRADLARHCLKLDLSFHKRHTPGELIDRVDGDINRLGNFFSQLWPLLLGNGLLVAGILALLMLEDPRVGGGMLLYTALTLVVLGLIQRPAAARWAAERQASAEKFSFLEERISGVEDLRACGAEPYALNRLLVLMRRYLEKLRAAFVVSNLTYNLTNLVYAAGYAMGLALGVYLYTRGHASLGTAYLIVYYVGMLSEPLQGIRRQIQDLQQASASLQRVRELFAIQSRLGNGASASAAAHLPSGPLEVSFEQVSFAYQDGLTGGPNGLHAKLEEASANAGGVSRGSAAEDEVDGTSESLVLEEISFRLQAGKVLGVLGRTGSGKSTLTRLLFRLYDPAQGAIRLGGTDLRAVATGELRQRVGMVTQEVQLFDASVRANLSFFNPAITTEQIEAALKNLRLWDWVKSLPQGLETRLAGGTGGSASSGGLSAGEAQLLAFARVFLKDPGLVILDEASSRLDPITENLMEQAVDRLFAGRTGILIAHRLKTVQRADEILILENGRVIEAGPRPALAVDRGSRFYALLQTGMEEVLA
jgi:ATP-binding cassette subfamily B protein